MCFDTHSGYWLEEHPDISVGISNIFGSTPYKVDKIFKTFGSRKRNLGVLLSGTKGMGKTVFIRKMSEEALKRNMPVIIIKKNTPDIANFIEKIEQ